MRSFFLALLAVALLQACATPYQRSGFSGGYSETQLDSNVFRVSFRGNGFTNRDKAADLVLLRSAELTLTNGFKYFSVIDADSYTSTSQISTPTTSYTNAHLTSYGNTAYGTATTTTYGGQSYNISKPTSTNTIVCFKERPTNGFSYSAEFIYKNLSQKYGRSHVLVPSEFNQSSEKAPRIDPQKIKVFIFANGDEIRKEFTGEDISTINTLLKMLDIKDDDKETAILILKRLATQNASDINFAEKVIDFYGS